MTKCEPTNPVTTDVSIDDALDERAARLRQENKSPATIRVYSTAVVQLGSRTEPPLACV